MSRRKMKVSYRFRQKQWGAGVREPFIRLAGQYLSDAGFEAGSEVSVDVEQGKITITVDPRTDEK